MARTVTAMDLPRIHGIIAINTPEPLEPPEQRLLRKLALAPNPTITFPATHFYDTTDVCPPTEYACSSFYFPFGQGVTDGPAPGCGPVSWSVTGLPSTMHPTFNPPVNTSDPYQTGILIPMDNVPSEIGIHYDFNIVATEEGCHVTHLTPRSFRVICSTIKFNNCPILQVEDTDINLEASNSNSGPTQTDWIVGLQKT